MIWSENVVIYKCLWIYTNFAINVMIYYPKFDVSLYSYLLLQLGIFLHF